MGACLPAEGREKNIGVLSAPSFTGLPTLCIVAIEDHLRRQEERKGLKKYARSTFLCVLWSFFSHPGGSLQDVLLEKAKTADYLKEPELKEILLQVSMGLKYIHTSGLVHLDIKPSKDIY